MFIGKTSILIAVIALTAAMPHESLYAASQEGHASGGSSASAVSSVQQAPVFSSMPGFGEKVVINNDYYIVCGFDRKPKMGTVILKVSVYTKDGNKDTSLELAADSGMPSMRGAHDTGDLPMQLSRNKEYLLPINIVMPGEWEIRLTIKKAGKVMYRGSCRFDV
jgi:hypothetical protein